MVVRTTLKMWRGNSCRFESDYPHNFKEFIMYTFDFCDKHLNYIAEGTCRIVYGIDESNVIKKAYTNGGYWQNKNEIELYRKYKDTILPLCPIDLSLSTEDDIFMPFTETVNNSLDDSVHEFWNDLDSVLMNYIYECVDHYNDDVSKSKFIASLEARDYDNRIVDFMKKLTYFDSDFIAKTLYDVCSFNCGLLNNEVVITDYGYPDCDYDETPDFYKNNSVYDQWLNKNCENV